MGLQDEFISPSPKVGIKKQSIVVTTNIFNARLSVEGLRDMGNNTGKTMKWVPEQKAYSAGWYALGRGLQRIDKGSTIIWSIRVIFNKLIIVVFSS